MDFYGWSVSMYVRQVQWCSQVDQQLQQQAEIKRFSWRQAPVVLYSDLCLWQCAINTHTHTNQEPLNSLCCLCRIHTLNPNQLYMSPPLLNFFICGTSSPAVSAGCSGRRHHQAEWCHPAHFIGFIVGSFLFPHLLDSIALWGRPGRPNVTGTNKHHAALKTLFLLLASPLPLHFVVLTIPGITCKD